ARDSAEHPDRTIIQYNNRIVGGAKEATHGPAARPVPSGRTCAANTRSFAQGSAPSSRPGEWPPHPQLPDIEIGPPVCRIRHRTRASRTQSPTLSGAGARAPGGVPGTSALVGADVEPREDAHRPRKEATSGTIRHGDFPLARASNPIQTSTRTCVAANRWAYREGSMESTPGGPIRIGVHAVDPDVGLSRTDRAPNEHGRRPSIRKPGPIR